MIIKTGYRQNVKPFMDGIRSMKRVFQRLQVSRNRIAAERALADASRDFFLREAQSVGVGVDAAIDAGDLDIAADLLRLNMLLVRQASREHHKAEYLKRPWLARVMGNYKQPKRFRYERIES